MKLPPQGLVRPDPHQNSLDHQDDCSGFPVRRSRLFSGISRSGSPEEIASNFKLANEAFRRCCQRL